MPANIINETSTLETNGIVEFIELDFTSFGGELLRFCNSSLTPGSPVTFLKKDWISLPFVSSGWKYDGTGNTPRPIIVVPDYNSVFLAYMTLYDDMLGALITRYVTTANIVITRGTEANKIIESTGQYNMSSDLYLGPERWKLNAVSEYNGEYMKIELASIFDIRNKSIPSRRLYRNEFPGLSR